MVKSKIESELNKASKKAVKGAIRSTKKSVKKSIKKGKKAVKKAVKAVKKVTKKKPIKKKVRTSVSGRKYRGLNEATKQRIEARAKEKARTDLDVQHAINLANNRLRNLEKLNLIDDSNEYRLVKKYAVEQPNSKGKIYNFDEENEDKIRFLNYSEYSKLSQEDRKYFRQVLRNFLASKTSTKSGINKKYEKAYETFMGNYGDQFPSMELEDYKSFFKVYRDMVKSEKDSQRAYNALVQTLNFIDIESALSAGDMAEVLRYVYNDEWGNIPRRYRQQNYW